MQCLHFPTDGQRPSSFEQLAWKPTNDGGWLGVGHGRSGVQPSTAATRPEEEARAGLDLHDEISRGARRAQARSAALYRWCVEAGGEWNLVETTGNLAENGGLRWLKIAGHTISGHT